MATCQSPLPIVPAYGYSTRFLRFLTLIVGISLFVTNVSAIHHMAKSVPSLHKRQEGTVPIIFTNNCSDIIYPGITTQFGDGPELTGFRLDPNWSDTKYVSRDWQGRIWGRTNCSFNYDGTGPVTGNGRACGTGDCNGLLECLVTGDTPVTLAEFTLDAGDGFTYYDISLVDGYNLPMAIVLQPNGSDRLFSIPSNLTNPSCQGTAVLLPPPSYNPYEASPPTFLGTTRSTPLPLESELEMDEVSRWCPWSLQVNPPTEPQDGIYPYPDHQLQRPAFCPCFSSCAKWNLPEDCCTGMYASPSTCRPSEYSESAKKVCPDAYSYAFDDQSSTFIVPSGGGFEIVFCPRSRSTNILATDGADLVRLTQGETLLSRNYKKLVGGNAASEVRVNVVRLLVALCGVAILFATL